MKMPGVFKSYRKWIFAMLFVLPAIWIVWILLPFLRADVAWEPDVTKEERAGISSAMKVVYPSWNAGVPFDWRRVGARIMNERLSERTVWIRKSESGFEVFFRTPGSEIKANRFFQFDGKFDLISEGYTIYD